MTDEEFDVLDELYFVYSFDHVKNELEWDDKALIKVLKLLVEKGWVRCFINAHDELQVNEVDIDSNFNQYFYLASKAGLFAHNGR